MKSFSFHQQPNAVESEEAKEQGDRQRGFSSEQEKCANRVGRGADSCLGCRVLKPWT